MTQSRRRLSESPVTFALGLALAVALAACNAGTSASPSSPDSTHVASAPGGSPSAEPTSSVGPSDGGPSGSPGGVGQTDTEWGRIWDALPASFPTYPGSVPTETGSGPSSAQFAVPADVETVVTFMQAGLEDARYSTEALSGPMEDGSRIIDSIGENPACRVQTVVAPTGGTTTVTVRYGAECPFG